MPLVGWSHCALEGGMTSCSVTWNEQSTNVISYNIAIFIFVYIIPIVLILYFIETNEYEKKGKKFKTFLKISILK